MSYFNKKTETHVFLNTKTQFGLFAGQLGDGAAISLGEIINRNEERWDLQLKGSGPTPYSRMADGRKVLRSSIREFLCSEAMHYLRVPTTRAATCVVSSDRVVRDALYDGNIRAESCAVVSRLAPSFIRFGSFENFRPIDRTSYNLGGCVGQIDLLHRLFDHTIETLYPEILARHSQLTDPAERRSAQCVDFFGTIVQRTARLVARWQTIGFCHGVLNTDNMSILGLTLDYGPYGFVERFDPNMISNHSDSSGYYSFDRQVAACRWNLCRLAEMLSLMVDSIDSLRSQLTDHYSKVYADEFLSEWRLKLGLGSELQRGHDQIWSDRKLIGELLNVLYQTGSDYTNCVRKLSLMTHEEIRGDRDDFDFIVQELLTERIPLKAFVQQLTNEVDSIDYQVSNHSIDSIVPDNLIDASNEKTHFCDKDMLLRDIQVQLFFMNFSD